MDEDGTQVLTINSGSSSIKFALYRAGDPPLRGLEGRIERVGLPGTSLSYRDPVRDESESRAIGDLDREAAAQYLCEWLVRRADAIGAIGHRIVHGGPRYHEPETVTRALLDELRRIQSYAPEHMPAGIEMIDLFAERMPGVRQVACFDTAFHRGMPDVARRLPLPRRLKDEGVERYGFHGLSYAYLMEELARVAGPGAARGRVVLAHLGNGASLAAVREGRSMDTSMGFTPAAGVPMSTRSGDLDPGLVWYLAQTQHMTPEQFHRMVNHDAGLLGVSGTSSDMRDLLAHEPQDPRAAEAVALFCYQVKKWIGAFAAALGGLDTLVFAGGIGENAPVVRARICEGLEFLGVSVDPGRNAGNAPLVSTDASRVQVRVMPTDEDVMIAKSVFRLLAGESGAAA